MKFHLDGMKDLAFLTFFVGLLFFGFMLLFEPIHAIPILSDLLPGYSYKSPIMLLQDFIPVFTLLSGISMLILLVWGLWRYWN